LLVFRNGSILRVEASELVVTIVWHLQLAEMGAAARERPPGPTPAKECHARTVKNGQRCERGRMSTSSTGVKLGDERSRLRQCGRCRRSFPADPALHPVAIAEWWLCPPCREALLGHADPTLVNGDPGVRTTPC
jgi:hypothetical protein